MNKNESKSAVTDKVLEIELAKDIHIILNKEIENNQTHRKIIDQNVESNKIVRNIKYKTRKQI